MAGGRAGDGPRLPGPAGGRHAGAAVADKARDAGTGREAACAAGAAAAVPPRRGRERVPCDRHPHEVRFVAERFFGGIGRLRRVATRHGRKAAGCLGFVRLAAVRVVLA